MSRALRIIFGINILLGILLCTIIISGWYYLKYYGPEIAANNSQRAVIVIADQLQNDFGSQGKSLPKFNLNYDHLSANPKNQLNVRSATSLLTSRTDQTKVLMIIFDLNLESSELISSAYELPSEIALGFRYINQDLATFIESEPPRDIIINIPIVGSGSIFGVNPQISESENVNVLKQITNFAKKIDGFYLNLDHLFNRSTNAAAAVINYIREHPQTKLINMGEVSDREILEKLYGSWINFIDVDFIIDSHESKTEEEVIKRLDAYIHKVNAEDSKIAKIGMRATHTNINALKKWLMENLHKTIIIVSLNQALQYLIVP